MNSVAEQRLNKLYDKTNLCILAVVGDQISDLLYAVPYLRTLRQQFPKARIDLLANPYSTPILKGCPYIDHIIPFFRFRQGGKRYPHPEALKRQASAWSHLVGRVDLVIHFRDAGPKILLFCEAFGRPFQAGYNQGNHAHFLDLNLGSPDTRLSSRERNASILEALGIPSPSPKMEMWVAQEDRTLVIKWLSASGIGVDEPYIVLHPGCHWGCNEWLPDRWSKLGDELVARYGGHIVITGTQQERPLAKTIAQGMRSPAVIAAGKSTIPQFTALLDQAGLVVSVDTAPTQICQALSIPAVILMGDGNLAWNGPLPDEPMVMLQRWQEKDDDSRRCDFAGGACHASFCRSRLTGIQVEMALDAADNVLKEQLFPVDSD